MDEIASTDGSPEQAGTAGTGTIELEIQSLTNGPDAVARHEGRVVFVPAVAPGDRVRVRIVSERRSYARAEITERVADGPTYRIPPCPYVAACGGCPWQQVTYAAQLDAKARNVTDTLARIGGLTPRRVLPIIPAPHEWHYRHRIRLHVGPGGQLGFLQPRSHTIVDVDACTVAEPALSALIPPLRAHLPRFATQLTTVELVSNGRGGVVVVAAADGPYRAPDEDAVTDLLRDVPAIAGVRLRSRHWDHSWGDPTVTVVPDLVAPPIVQSAGTFTQVNPEANHLLVRAVVEMATPATQVLDLYCGAGNLSIPLGRVGQSVLGIDRNREAIAAAQAGAATAGFAHVRFTAAPVERFLETRTAPHSHRSRRPRTPRSRQMARHERAADLVVLDPPRSGAAAAIRLLARSRPPRILYVSCDPATLARDARILVQAGYTVERVQPLDLFPQTEHVETILEAVRHGSSY